MRIARLANPPRFGMASKEGGRDPKAKWDLAKALGEGVAKTSAKEMSKTGSDGSVQSRDKEPTDKWLFTKEQLQSTPSRKDNVTVEKELNYRQQAANLIQDMGQRLPVNQLTINTAIVYMHRFYMFHSFQSFSRFLMAPTALFLAAKVEEQPRKLEHVIKVCHSCLHPDKPHLDVHSDNYLKQAQELVQNELIMLQTLGFDISIDHPHTHVVKCTQLVKASRDLSQMAYFMATNSLHLTTFCLKYKPTVVSAMCIHLSCKWSNYEIPLSSTGKAYWTYMDSTITEALLENIINEFLQILNLCPTRLRKLKNYKPSARDGGGSTPSSKDGQQAKPTASKGSHHGSHSAQHSSEARHAVSNQSDQQKKHTASITIAEYKNKREKELQNKQTHLPGNNDSEREKVNLIKQHKSGLPSGHPTSRNLSSAQHHSQGAQRPSSRPGPHHADRPNLKGGPGPAAHSRHAMQPHSGHPAVTTGPQNQHPKPDKMIHSKTPNVSEQHRKQEKSHSQPQKQSIPPTGMSGLQRPRPHHTQHQEGVQQTQKGIAPPQSVSANKPGAVASQPQHKDSPFNPVKTERLKDSNPTFNEPATFNQSPANGVNRAIDDKDLEMKIMEQMKAEKSGPNENLPSNVPTGTLPAMQDLKHSQAVFNHRHNPAKDHSSKRQAFPGHSESSHSQSQQPLHVLDSKAMYEQYKKDPDALRRYLKRKALTESLTEEEKNLLHKCKKKDEERQKRKREHKKHKAHNPQPTEILKPAVAEEGTPPGGPLTVRIKLPPSVRAEISKNPVATVSPGSRRVIGSSSGSGSEAVTSSPGGVQSKSGRKRAHGQDSGGLSDSTSAKQSRKSEGHHHHQSHHESSRSGKHRHGRQASHHHHHHSKSHQSGQKIDEAMFQRALEDAVSMVQSGQAAPGANERPVQTTTLKHSGFENGGQEARSSRHEKHKSSRHGRQGGFDPSAPVSETLPRDLLEGEDGSKQQETDHMGHSGGTGTDNYMSSPETGEIRDDEDDMSPLSQHVSGYSSMSKDQESHMHRRANANNNNLSSLPYQH